MLINSVVIELQGEYQLPLLKQLGFNQIGSGAWIFSGKLHRYEFRAIDTYHLTLTMVPRNIDIKLPHRITMGNFNDWVRRCLDTITLH